MLSANGWSCNGAAGSLRILSQILCRGYTIIGLKSVEVLNRHGDFLDNGGKLRPLAELHLWLPLLVRAIVRRAVQKGQLIFACLVAIGFHALLRTGEILALRYCDFEFSTTCGVVNLGASKSGLRTGSEEAVALRDETTLLLLDTLWSQAHFPGQKLWPFSGQSFRETLRSHLRFFRVCHLQYKPYSLRRGWATYLLQQGVPLEAILLRGRWKSLSVGRLYLEDGLAQLPSLRIPLVDLARIKKFADESSPTTFEPQRS